MRAQIVAVQDNAERIPEMVVEIRDGLHLLPNLSLPNMRGDERHPGDDAGQQSGDQTVLKFELTPRGTLVQHYSDERVLAPSCDGQCNPGRHSNATARRDDIVVDPRQIQSSVVKQGPASAFPGGLAAKVWWSF